MVRTSMKWSIAQDVEEFYQPEPEEEECPECPDDYDDKYDIFYM